MDYYRHRFDKIEDYLHHRPPYLLVDEIVSIEDRCVVAAASVVESQPHLQGHFPGAPILPGAMMQEMTTQTAGILIAANYNPMPEYNTHDPRFNEFALGVLTQVKRARYRGFARPGDRLQITATLDAHLESYFEFFGKIMVGDKTIMQNRFQLANIRSAVLIGSEA